MYFYSSVSVLMLVFSIALPCTGSTSGEVDIKIQINITMYSPTNVTVLDLRRKKICLKG